jgi:hypothetical protein
MGRTSNESKQKWVAENRKQIKILAPPSIAEEFKAACAASGLSVNKTLLLYMESVIHKKPPKSSPVLHMSTKPQRRKSLQLILGQLSDLRDAAYVYNESIPENLRNGERFAQSESDLEKLEEAIEILEDVF